MKYIVATYKNKWLNDVLRTYYYLINHLIDVYDYKLIDMSDYEKNSTLDIVCDHIIYIENHSNILVTDVYTNFFDIKCKKYVIADDIHKEYERKKQNYYELFDKVFVTYYAPFINMYNIDKNKVHWLPHFFTPDFDLPYNVNPSNFVLLSGRMGNIYKLRKYVFKLSQNELKGKIKYLKHPNSSVLDYENPKHCIGKRYAKTIWSNISGFVDCATSQYVLAKYFEIAATGTLLLAENPNGDSLDKLGFIDGVNYISCNKDNIIEKIEYILNNRDIVDGIRKNGQLMVKERHNLIVRAKQLYDVIACDK